MRRRFPLAVLSIAVLILGAAAPAFSQAPQTQLDEIAATTRETKQAVDSLKGQSWIRDWGPVLAGVLTAAVAIYSLRANLNTTRKLADQTRQTTEELARQNVEMAKRGIQERAREEERRAIREKIDQFYGPFVRLREMSSYIYKTLFFPRRTDQENKDYTDGKRYRTIIALVRGHTFSQEDLDILKRIVAIGQQTAELIQIKIGLVDKAELVKVLPHALVHFWLIDKLVNGGFKVTDPAERPYYEKLTFPEDLDPAVNAELKRLQERLAELQT